MTKGDKNRHKKHERGNSPDGIAYHTSLAYAWEVKREKKFGKKQQSFKRKEKKITKKRQTPQKKHEKK